MCHLSVYARDFILSTVLKCAKRCSICRMLSVHFVWSRRAHGAVCSLNIRCMWATVPLTPGNVVSGSSLVNWRGQSQVRSSHTPELGRYFTNCDWKKCERKSLVCENGACLISSCTDVSFSIWRKLNTKIIGLNLKSKQYIIKSE